MFSAKLFGTPKNVVSVLSSSLVAMQSGAARSSLVGCCVVDQFLRTQ